MLTFELEISTMHKTKEECFAMLEKMNVCCNCIIINQCDCNDYFEKVIDGQHVRIFFTTERGLSKSRNMALRNCNADILGIADDDLYYYDDFDKIIIDYYQTNKNADIVLFNMQDCYKAFSNKNHKCSFFELSGFKSVQMTMNIKNVIVKGIFFNEYFGTGSKYIQSGEENIFLADCYRNKLQIYYCKKQILRRELTQSSWFKGWTEDFIKDRGAIYFVISKMYFPLYVLRFALKNYKKYYPVSVFQAVILMSLGKKEYMRIYKESCKKEM